MAQPEVTIYVTPTCTHCRQAKAYFQRKGVRYSAKYVDVERPAPPLRLAPIARDHTPARGTVLGVAHRLSAGASC